MLAKLKKNEFKGEVGRKNFIKFGKNCYKSMNRLILPPLSGKSVPLLPKAHQLSIIGGSGAGKTRFMEKLMELNGDRVYCLSAVSAPFPEREESKRLGSIDRLYREAVKKQPYMRTDAVSELDKLIYMLFIDELEYLLDVKEKRLHGEKDIKLKPTKLDKLARLWEKIYPGNRIVRSRGSLMFSTMAGDDQITTKQLSQGEVTSLYYAAGVLYAMPNAVIFIDSPSLFLHPTVLNNLWNGIEELRPDCTFVYNSVGVDFVSSRSRNVCIWVKSFNARMKSWDYEILPPGEINEEIFVDLIGTRKPVLFIEGDMSHSIDARLYPLVFSDYTVKPLGSCDKVIETTRTFNSLKNMHHLESKGIVDRDRRTDREVDYLRKKEIMVAEVAEIENLFLLENVIRNMAIVREKDEDRVFTSVKNSIIREFRRMMKEQALQHTRYQIKREMEHRVDGRFSDIIEMEKHLNQLTALLNPRKQYGKILSEFRYYADNDDYNSILKVFNHKPMLGECGVAKWLGYSNVQDYIRGVLKVLRTETNEAENIRNAIRNCFN